MDCVINETLVITSSLLTDGYFGGLLRAERTPNRKITSLNDGFLVQLATMTSEELSILIDLNSMKRQALACKLRCLAFRTNTELKKLYDFLISTSADCLKYLNGDLPNNAVEAYFTHTSKDAPVDAELIAILAQRDPTILTAAVKHKHPKIANFLVNEQLGVSLSTSDCKALEWACCNNRMETVLLWLLDVGGCSNGVNKKGETLLIKVISCKMEAAAGKIIDAKLSA